MKTRLAWLNLLHDPTRTFVAVAGVAFAVVLILVQLGFLNSVKQTATQIYSQLNFDVLLVSPQYLRISKSGAFPQNRLYQAMSVPGVRDADPLYLGFNLWLNTDASDEQRRRRGIFVMGFDLGDRVFRLPEVEENVSPLNSPGHVLMDLRSRGEFGDWDVGSRREIGGAQVTIVGKFAMGTGFGADGAIICSDRTYARLFPGRPLSSVSLGLIHLEPGSDADDVARRLRETLPEDVRVFTRAEIEEQERDHWVDKTSVGIIFTFGVFVGFVVGTAIVYQVLSSDIANHLPEYATLKAMGYGPGYLASVVLEQALTLALIGYVPGLVISLAVYSFTSQAALIPMDLTPLLAVGMLLGTILMCSISGLASLRKVNAADPADLF